MIEAKALEKTFSPEPDCPEAQGKRVGDEVYIYCKLEEIMCWREHGYGCEYYENYLKELEDDEEQQKRRDR